MKSGKLIIITGPSAVGKTVVAKELLKKIKNSKRIITYTTRRPRAGEKDGVDYNFLSKQEFEKKLKEDFFIEWATVYKQYYGNSGEDIESALQNGHTIIMVLDVQGMKTIKEKLPKAIAFFILPESSQQLEKRLWERPDANEENIKTRLNKAKSEIKNYQKSANHSIINQENQLNKTIKQIITLIA